MKEKKNIFAINGSASSHSCNLEIIEYIAKLGGNDFQVTIFNELKSLPPFDPELSTDDPPQKVIDFRNSIDRADAIIICTPEYIYSIPSGLKNAIEWCIATTIFIGKPCAFITAAAGGEKAHEELQLIMKTALASFSVETTLLIRGAKGKLDAGGQLADNETKVKLQHIINALLLITTGNG